MSKSLKELIENADETIKGAYEKGYSDGRAARDMEIVRCKDCVFLEVLNSEHYYARCKWHGRLFPSFGNPDTRYYFCADCQGREDNDEIH